MPLQCEIEWRIKPLLAEWADVASYDLPGVGDEPPSERADMQAMRDRGLKEIDRHGWESYLIVGDEHGCFPAIEVASARPEPLVGLALGHPALSYRQHGERAPINGEVIGAFNRMAELDYRSYARAMTQITQDAYDDETAEEFIRRVPQELTLAYLPVLNEYATEGKLEPMIRDLDRPLLFAKHEGCLAWTDEGWEDAVAAFPEATTMSVAQKPSASPEFAAALREFCDQLDWG